jgi:hypothetical protein
MSASNGPTQACESAVVVRTQDISVEWEVTLLTKVAAQVLSAESSCGNTRRPRTRTSVRYRVLFIARPHEEAHAKVYLPSVLGDTVASFSKVFEQQWRNARVLPAQHGANDLEQPVPGLQLVLVLDRSAGHDLAASRVAEVSVNVVEACPEDQFTRTQRHNSSRPRRKEERAAYQWKASKKYS